MKIQPYQNYEQQYNQLLKVKNGSVSYNTNTTNI